MTDGIKIPSGHTLQEKRVDCHGKIKTYITLSPDGKKYNLFVCDGDKYVKKATSNTPKFK